MPSTTPAPAQSAFDGCAGFYDRLTAHHDYELWTSVLEGAARRHGLAGTRLLDLACGTGKSFIPMLERGYEVVGCDLCEGMLAQAEAKAGGRAELHLADMCALPALGRFDLVTCIDEPLNYLLDPADVGRAFRSAADCLDERGIYLFDVNTLHTYRSIFARDDCYESDGWLFVWRGEGDGSAGPGSQSSALIEAFAPRGEGCWRRFSNRHFQRHHAHDFVVDALEASGLSCLGAYGQHPDGTLEDDFDELRHTKRIYVTGLAT